MGGLVYFLSCPVIVKSFSNGNEISLDPYYCLALMVICNNHYALPPCMYLCSQIVQKCMTKWEKIQSNIPDTLAKWDLFSCSAALLASLGFKNQKKIGSDLIVKSVSYRRGNLVQQRWLLSYLEVISKFF